MSLGSTQPLTEMGTRSISWGVKSCWCVRLKTLPPSWSMSRPPCRAWFEASFPPLYISLKGSRLLIGRRGGVKVMGVAFRSFLCRNAFVSITLVLTAVLIFSSWVQLSDCTICPGKERGAPSSAVCFQERATRTSGHVLKVKFCFGLCIFELTFSCSLNMSPDVCLASPRTGADTVVPSRE